MHAPPPPATSRPSATADAIVAHDLSRSFTVPVRDSGLGASVRSLFRRETRQVDAVADVSFTIPRGQIVGFLGPNGAGKTTTLKLLSGLLHPTAGTAQVLGYEPARRSHDFLGRIALIMGQRQSIEWDLPALDSFEVFRAIYDVPRSEYQQRLDELAELLTLGPLLNKPARQLSLGERMRCEIAAGLLHGPEVVFLDEPTLGLDVAAQRALREFIVAYAARSGATVLLTSHYMADIQALAERVLVIDNGRLQFDGALADLTRRTSDRKLVTVQLDGKREGDVGARFAHVGDVVRADALEVVIELPRADVRERLAALVAIDGIEDFTVEDEPIERIIERVFAGERS